MLRLPNSRHLILIILFSITVGKGFAALTDYVNPLLGTATLWEAKDLGYERKQKGRTWGAEVFPGAALPNAMVQLTPVTMWRSGAGYQYEDPTILGFAHTAMGHWNYLDLPVMPVVGTVTADDYASGYSHSRECARPGYYQVFLDRYGINAELTSTLRTGVHRYTFPKGQEKKLLVNVARNQNPVRDWDISQEGEYAFAGRQGNVFFFYAVVDRPIVGTEILKSRRKRGVPVAIINFGTDNSEEPLVIKIGISSVSIENAKANLEAESLCKTFEEVADEADGVWENLLGKVNVEGSSERYRQLLYTTLYRASLMPRLLSDVNGDYRDNTGNVVRDSGFRYYSNPAFWDVHRNQLILLGMLQPDVALDVIKSTIDRGEKAGGYIPSYFHGDHAPTFVIGSYLRGIREFDLGRAYALALKSATVPGKGGRPYLDEYLANGYVADENLPYCPFDEEHKGGVAKTIEYAYDDYAVALMARELGDEDNQNMLMERSKNYRNVFDPSTGFFRGRVAGGGWMTPYNPYYPYYQQMYREANAWNVLFYAPHDPEGVLALYGSPERVEAKLDSLLTEPWCGMEVANMTGFIGNYCHGNQPGHNIPYTYYFIGQQERSQRLINRILDTFYDMGSEGLAYCGMDDAGEMSAWFALNALGLYTFSPADPEYIMTVPLFDRVEFSIGERPFIIERRGNGEKITEITVDGERQDGYFIDHAHLARGARIVVATE